MPADEYIKKRKFQLFNEGYQGPTDYTGPAIGDLDRINLDTPEIDPVQSYVERQKPAYQPHFKQEGIDPLLGVLETVDYLTAAPIRTGAQEAIKAEGGPWEKFKAFGKGVVKSYANPMTAPTGKDVMAEAGLSTEGIRDRARRTGKLENIALPNLSPAGVGGFFAEGALDATNLVGAGMLGAGVKKIGKLDDIFPQKIDVFGTGNHIEYRNPETGDVITKINMKSGDKYFVSNEKGKQVGKVEKGRVIKEFNNQDDALKALDLNPKKISYKNIPSDFKGDSRVIAKKLIDAGIPVERLKSSAKSDSKYMQVGDLKVRVSDHELPWQYPQSDLEYFKGQDIDDFIKKVKQNYDEYQTLDDDAKAFFSEAKKLGIDRDMPQANQPLTNNLKAIAPIAGPWLYFQTKEDNNGR